MSIDVLQNKIRKLKNPLLLTLAPRPELIPEKLRREQDSLGKCYGVYCRELLEGLKDLVPGIRVSFDAFALQGVDGLVSLGDVLGTAKELGYYVVLDWMHLEDPGLSQQAAECIVKQESWPCDALALSVWAGSDCVKPYIAAAGDKKKDIYVCVKTGNKSGTELQDLQTGGRVVYTAAGDLVSRWGEGMLERCGYSRVAAVAGAVNAVSLRTLREKYHRVFLMVEGLETSGANAKNCSYAFDRMGHGAVCCAGASVLGAWQEDGTQDHLAAAREAVERHKRNLSRYVTVL